MSGRIRRVNSLLKEELAKIILKEIEFDPGFFVTVSEVSTSTDLRHAKVYVSVIPKDKEKNVIRLLGKNKRNLQLELNRRIKLQYIPKINFLIDNREERASRIEEIIAREAKRNEQ